MRPHGLAATSVVDAIGNTPLVQLKNILPYLKLPPTTRLFAKLDNLNPGGSKKDRVAKQIVLDGYESGELVAGQPIVELTSGNTGTGLAIVSAALNHEFIAVMSAGNSIERARQMRALGAEVVLVPQAPGSVDGQVSGKDLELVREVTESLTQERNCFRADQFRLKGSWRAHYNSTGPEIWEATGGGVGTFVDFVGSGGTLVGCGKYFKEVKNGFKCYAVEPLGNEVLKRGSGGKLGVGKGGHRIQGGGYEMTFNELELFKDVDVGGERELGARRGSKRKAMQRGGLKRRDRSKLTLFNIYSAELVDGFVSISDKEAVDAARLLAKKEGIFGGFSAGANLSAAAKVIMEGKVEGEEGVAFMVCDNGLKYLSTDLYL
jgi:cysteine synthase